MPGPVKLRKLEEVLKEFGVAVVKCGGRHPYKATRGGISFPFKAHKGMNSEVSGNYLNSLARAFDIDIDVLLGKLRGE